MKNTILANEPRRNRTRTESQRYYVGFSASATSGAAPQGSPKQNGRAMSPAVCLERLTGRLVLSAAGSRRRARRGGRAAPPAGAAATFGTSTGLSDRLRRYSITSARCESARQTGKGHVGAGDVAARVLQKLVEFVEGPGAALGLHRRREVEAAAAGAALVADDVVEVRADAVRAALLEGVAGGALLGGSGALFQPRRWPAAFRSVATARPDRPFRQPRLP